MKKTYGDNRFHKIIIRFFRNLKNNNTKRLKFGKLQLLDNLRLTSIV